jgi:predicted transcriptional regulator
MDKNATFSLSVELLERLEKIAKRSRLKKSTIVDIALTEFLNEWEVRNNVTHSK